jgi:hypothetical protein
MNEHPQKYGAFLKSLRRDLEKFENYHEVEETMADAMNDEGILDKSVTYHRREARRLRAIIKLLK